MLMKKNFKFKWLENTKKNRKGKMIIIEKN